MKRKLYIGDVCVEYILVRKKVKNLNLRVKSDGSICVSANNGVSVEFIDRFIEKNSKKILEFIEENKIKNQNNPINCKYDNGEKTNYLGKTYTVYLKKGDEDCVNVSEGCFEIVLKNVDNEQEKIKVVEKWYNKKINEIFSEINDIVAAKYKKYNIPKARFKSRYMVSRWGSCKVNNEAVTINSRLIYYPYACIEAVFVHEYAHFIHYYHDKSFYELVLDIMPSYKEWDKILKQAIWG